MKKLLLLLFAATATIAAELRFTWDPNDPAEEVTAYRLYSSTNIAGPFVFAAETSGSQTNLTLTNAFYGQAFYYVVAVNFWTNSLPSGTVHTPAVATPVKGLFLSLSEEAKSYVLRLSKSRRQPPPTPR